MNTNNINNHNLNEDFPTLTEMFSELYRDELKTIIADGFVYISIMWKRVEIIDDQGYRAYAFEKPIKLVSEIGEVNAPEYCRLIVKNPKITEDENYVYIRFVRTDYNKVTGETWSSVVADVMQNHENDGSANS